MRSSDWSSEGGCSDLRQALAEVGDVPGAVDGEAEIALAELVPDGGDRGVAHPRRPALVEDFLVERQRAPEALAAEVAVAAAAAQQRVVDGEVEQRFEL